MPALIVPGAPIVSRRLRLSPLAAPDLEAMLPWLEGALAPDWTSTDLEAPIIEGRGVLIADVEGAPLGAAVVVPDAPLAGAACLPLIAIEPSRRYRGLGSEACLALERHVRARGVERVYAPVPDGRGLAVYFWLRLGYRPLTSVEASWPLVGLTAAAGIWLVRESA